MKPINPKVFYIGGDYESCYYVRCLIPLLANGWDGDKITLERIKKTPEQIQKGVMQADVVVFHRPIDKQRLETAKLLKSIGKKIVMDNDDTYIKDSGVPLNMQKALEKELKDAVQIIDNNLKEFASISDMVTVTTETLAKEYSEYCDNIQILKNCVDKRDWFKPKEKDSKKVRIGVVGSVASNKDYEQIKPLLEVLKKRKDVQLVLFALPPITEHTKLSVEMYKPEYKFWMQYNPEWHHFVPVAQYQKKLNDLKLDIMLIPRVDSYFNRAKSNLKFLEASMCKTVVIAQGFNTEDSPYQNKKDRQYMEICYNSNDWIEKTIELIENKDKRQKLSENAYNYVLKEYDISNNKDLWKEAYKTLWKE